MLVLRRKDGQWIEVIHRSGDVLRFRVYEICGEAPGRANLAFDDPDRNFAIERPERLLSRHSPDPGAAHAAREAAAYGIPRRADGLPPAPGPDARR